MLAAEAEGFNDDDDDDDDDYTRRGENENHYLMICRCERYEIFCHVLRYPLGDGRREI